MNAKYFKFRYKCWKASKLIWEDYMTFFPGINSKFSYYNRIRRIHGKPLHGPIRIYWP